MKKGSIFILLVLLILLVIVVLTISNYGFSFHLFTGKIVSEQKNKIETHTIGPSLEEQACMMTCMGCSSIGINCTGNQEECQTKCSVQKPEATEETSCMEKCVLVGCGAFDFSCQGKNQEKCEKECNMIKEPEAKSEEEQCIRDCVKLHSPKTICKPSSEGEQGNDVCKMCANQCVHLYAGPCLDDQKLKAKQKDCETCEHCYGEPIMGDSGEGWECIVDVECKDASSEFGDNPGAGEGIIGKVGNIVDVVVDSIGNFFQNIFSRGNAEKISSDVSNN